MAEEIAFENGMISNFHGLVTLTLDHHTVVHSRDSLKVIIGLISQAG